MAFILKFLLTLLLAGLTGIYLRLLVLLNPKRNKPLRHGRRNPNEPTHLMIVLGSGGHTTEMLSMLSRSVQDEDQTQRLHWNDYTHRTWVVSAGDNLSAARAEEFEKMAAPLSTQEGLMLGKVKRATDNGPGTYEVVTVPRAREIHQSLASSPMTSITCMQACRDVLLKYTTTTREGHGGQAGERDVPDLILVNGPATGTIMVFTSILLRFFDVKGVSTRGKMRTVYIESWARVKRLSLSGKLLRRVVDRFLVQWPQLKRQIGGNVEYLGVLVQ